MRFPSRTLLNNDAKIASISEIKSSPNLPKCFDYSQQTIRISSSSILTDNFPPYKFKQCPEITLPLSFGLKEEEGAAAHLF